MAGAGKILATGHIGDMPPEFTLQHSEQFTVESGNALQPRASIPDIVIEHDIPKQATVLETKVIGHVAEVKKEDTWKPDDL
jgi:hypothetical protein